AERGTTGEHHPLVHVAMRSSDQGERAGDWTFTPGIPSLARARPVGGPRSPPDPGSWPLGHPCGPPMRGTLRSVRRTLPDWLLLPGALAFAVSLASYLQVARLEGPQLDD